MMAATYFFRALHVITTFVLVCSSRIRPAWGARVVEKFNDTIATGSSSGITTTTALCNGFLSSGSK